MIFCISGFEDLLVCKLGFFELVLDVRRFQISRERET